MPDKNKEFTLKDYEQLIKDVLNTFFQEENVTHDIEELAQVRMGAPPVQETIEE